MKYRKQKRTVEPKICSECKTVFTMEEVGMDPDNAVDRLKFSRKKTCGAEACVKKAVGRKPSKTTDASCEARASELVTRTERDDAQEVTQHVRGIIRDLHSNTPGLFLDVDPRIAMYRRMMGREGYAA